MRVTATGIVFVAALAATSACSNSMDIEEVPVGADVQLVREDGALVEGKLADKGEMVVKVQTPRSTKIVARDEIAAVQVVLKRTIKTQGAYKKSKRCNKRYNCIHI
jgi:hypothetical protein